MLGFAILISAVALAQGCGDPAIPPTTNSVNIVGGTEARDGSWPWQVMIRKNGGQWCGGTIIDNDWVLTASHCFHPYSASDISKYEFIVGAHHIDNNSAYRVTKTASKIILHENYNRFSYSNDVTLIKMSTPISYNSHVSPACLPTNAPGPGVMSWVTGWGDQEIFIGPDDPYLQQVDVPIVSSVTCGNAYPGQIDDTMICAGYAAGGKDACQGDSGGPLVSQAVSGTWYVTGVVSWGSGCADAGKYGVYADTTYFNSWIINTMNSN